jgi:cytoskeletal protein RodZ
VESLGDKLRAAREEKELNFDQVSRETNIAIRYLEALEREDFSCFPGEAYIIGFLRNYGGYLELDVQELLGLYRALKVQEQPVPEQLLRYPSKFPKIALVLVIVVILGVVGGGVFFFLNRPPKTQTEVAALRSPTEYLMDSDAFERRFYLGDSILVPVGTDRYKLELLKLGEAVTMQIPSRPQPLILDLSREVTEDLNNDGIIDLRIIAADFAKNNAAMGVLLRFEMINAAAIPPLASSETTPETSPSETISSGALAGAIVIFSSPNAYPFTLQSNFQSFCMFRWEILFERDRRERNEQYYQRSQELTIPAQNGIRIWVSNAQAAKFQIIGAGKSTPIELGGAGEVVVADIRWVRDDDNRYRLVLIRLETGNS